MARPGSVTRAIPDNPLGSVIRDLSRDARKTTFGQGTDTSQLEDQIAALQAQVKTLTENLSVVTAALAKLQSDFQGPITISSGPC
jgi:hypothetical protein